MAESEASIEAQLELKKRARRRLVGAAALALFAAIVLPMVMDREPRPPSQDIQVRIPSQDGGSGFSSRIMPKPTATPLPPVTAGNEAPPAPAAEAKTEAKPDTKAEAKPDTKADKVPPPKPAPAPAVAAAAPAPKPEEPPVAKAPEKSPPQAAEAKPAESKPAHKTETKAKEAPAPADGGEWVVQLGAYKEAGNVKLLLAKLKQAGVPAYTEKFDAPQGARTRVRAGPFASKEAAEKARIKVKTIGVDGPVAPK